MSAMPEMPEEKPEGAIAIFVLGLLGILMCGILGIVAWVMGNNYIAQCRQLGVEPDGMAVAGRIMGMIGVAILVITVCGGILMLLLGLGAAMMGR